MTNILLPVMAIGSFLGAAFISIDIGIAQLTIFRIFLVFNIKLVFNYFKNKNKYQTTLLLQIWILYSLVSILWVNNYYLWFKSVFFLITGLLACIEIIEYLKKEKNLKILINWIIFIAIIFEMVGLYEYFTGNYIFTKNKSWLDALEIYKFRSPIFVSGNPNDYALVISFFLFVILIKYKESIKYHKKTFYLIMILISLFLIVVSTSRAVIIAVFVSLLFYFYMNRKRNSLIRNIIFIITIIIISIILINILIKYGLIEFNINSGGSDSIRLNLIKNGLYFLKNTAFIGVGSGNVEHWMSKYPKYFVGKTTNLHNWWIEVLVDYGIIIFVLYISYLVKIFNRLSLNDRNKRFKNYIVSMKAYMLCFFIGSITSSSNLNVEWHWIYYGICSGIIFIFNKKQ